MCCCCRSIICTRPIPSMMHVDWVRIASAGDTFFARSVASAALFVFRRDPSAFASAHGSGSMFTLLLSATRITWQKRFRSAFRTTFWRFIRDVFVLIVETFSVFASSSCRGITRMVYHRLIWSICTSDMPLLPFLMLFEDPWSLPVGPMSQWTG